MSITAELSPLAAYEALMQFAQRRGESAVRLAMHAAVPQGIQPELLHLLKRNFVPEAGDDPALEADILFSPLCEELGRGYFRFDPQVRALLLENLESNYAKEPESRIGKVADFLLAYVDHYDGLVRENQDQLWRDYLEVQRWVALAFADPARAAQQLAAALEKSSASDDFVARIQLGGLASALAAPLSNFPRLLNYAAGVQALELGDRERAGEFFETLQADELTIGNTTLRSPDRILADWHSRHPDYGPVPNESKQAEASEESKKVDDAINGLGSDEVVIRLQSAKALRQLASGSDQVVRALIDGLNDPVAEVRRACAVALSNNQTEAALVGLANAVADPDRQVGRTAADVLKRVGRLTVLVLGALGGRGAIRDTINQALLRWNYLSVAPWRPIASKNRLIEIAQAVEFIIVDLTDASRVLSDLQSLATELSIPIQPIVRRQTPIPSLLSDLQRYPSFMRPVTYNEVADLEGSLERVILPSIQAWIKERGEKLRLAEPRRSDFDYDVFISYAHIDNESRKPNGPPFIDDLTARLSLRLTQLMGKTPKIFRDTGPFGGETFAERLRDAINRSAVFVVVISNAYMNSEMCRTELNLIINASTRHVTVPNRSRIFKVFVNRFRSEQLPPELRETLGYLLESSATGRPELDLGVDRAFLEKLDDLAWDIQRMLETLRPTQRTAPGSPLQTVYLAETTRELRDERDRLKRTLEQQGYLVLPGRDLPIRAVEFKEAVETYLARSNVSIHLLGRRYGSYPDGGNRSISELQFELAGDRAMESTFSRFVWTPSNAKPESVRQQSLFERATARGQEFAQSSPEDLEQVILRWLGSRSQSQPADDRVKPPRPRTVAQLERWPIRTATDPHIPKVNKRVTQTTVEELIKQKRPGTLSHDQRSDPIETTIWAVPAAIKAFRKMQNGSYRLILEDDDGRTMNAEAPDPEHIDGETGLRSWFISVRRKLEEKLAFRDSYKYLKPPVPVRLEGIGYFSHMRGQTGAAINGVELQPLIDLRWLRMTTPIRAQQSNQQSSSKKTQVVKSRKIKPVKKSVPKKVLKKR